MKMNRTEIKETVNRVMKAAKKNSPMEIFSAICIDPAGTVKGQNATFSITEQVNIEANGEEAVYLDAARIFKILSHLKGDTVEIKADGNKVVITSENAKFEEPIMVGSFEEQKLGEPLSTVKVRTSELADVIQQVIHSVDKGDGSEIMGAINFKISENGLKATTLDGHRISIREIGDADDTLELNLKADDVKAWVSALTGDEVEIMNLESQVVLKSETSQIVMTKTNGDYYNVAQMLSMETKSFITVNKESLYDATNLALLNKKSNNRPLMVMEIVNGALQVSSTSDNGAGFNTTVVCQTNIADGFRIGVNSMFMVDALNSIDEDTVKMEIINEKSPIIMRASDYTEVVLPVSLN